MKCFLTLVLCLFLTCPTVLSQNVESTSESVDATLHSIKMPNAVSRGEGDLLRSEDIESLTGDDQLLGIEYDGTYWWFTGRGQGGNDHHLYQAIEDDNWDDWTLVNSFEQPVSHSGTVGWYDIAYHKELSGKEYLYCGNPNSHGMIDKINPADGTVVSTIGPFNPNPGLIRAIAYDTRTGHFWAAHDGYSYIYELDPTSNTAYQRSYYASQIRGMGIDESNAAHPMLWVWSGEYTTRAVEVDTLTGQATGDSFDGDGSIGGGAGGAVAFDLCGSGQWVFVGLHQSDPDTIAMYDLGVSTFLNFETEISASTGGSVEFELDAGAVNASRTYIICGGVTGTQPGTMLPGGHVTLPVNFDFFTFNIVFPLINTAIFSNFLGTLDGNGESSAEFYCPPTDPSAVGITINFAYCLKNPFDFASNPGPVHIVP